MPPAARHVGALCVVSWATIVLEVAYGRILSVALAPYFAAGVAALMVASRGVGALLVHWYPRRATDAALDRQLVAAMALLAAAAILCEVMFLEHLWMPQSLSREGLLLLAATIATFSVPELLCGWCGALVTIHAGPRLGLLFAARYTGIGLGFLCAVVAGTLIPTPFVPPLVAAAVAWAALLVAADAGISLRLPAAACGLAFLFGLIASSTPHVFRLLQVKQWSQPYAEHEAWSADTRLGVFGAGPGVTAAQVVPLARPAESYTNPPPPPFKWIDVDGSNWQPLVAYDGNPEPLAFFRDSVVYAAHHLRPGASVLIVGVGGGRDLLGARAFDQPRVLGLDDSPLMQATVMHRYDFVSGRPDARPGVRVHAGDVRGTLARTSEQFDVIQLGTASAGTIGGILPIGQYLLTREAVAEYRRHLTANGLLSVSLTLVPEYPFEVLRLLRTLREVWATAGAVDPGQHFVVVTQDFTATVLAQPEPFTAPQLAAIDTLAANTRLRIPYDPRRRAASTDDALLLLGPEGVSVLQTGVSQRPATDDRPFFRSFLRSPRQRLAPDPFGLLAEQHAAVRAGFLLAALLLAITAVTLAWPTGRAGPDGSSRLRARPLLFACYAAGFGFVLLQIPTLQWLSLLLGSSARTLAVGASSLYFGATLGGLASRRVAATRGRAAGAAAAVMIVALAYAIGLPRAVAIGLATSPAVAVLIAVAVATPLGFVLGLAHPQPLAFLAAYSADRMAWGFGLDAVAAATALATSTLIASQAGYTALLCAGAMVYAVVAIVLWTEGRAPASTV
jgi:hypothetical protein